MQVNAKIQFVQLKICKPKSHFLYSTAIILFTHQLNQYPAFDICIFTFSFETFEYETSYIFIFVNLPPPTPLFQLFFRNIQNSRLQEEKVKHLSCINKTPWGESCSVCSCSGRKASVSCVPYTLMRCAPAAHAAVFLCTTRSKSLSFHIRRSCNNRFSSD